MISNAEKIAIKRILQDPNWTVVQHVLDDLIKEIEASYVVKDTEWDTLKATIDRESQIQGIRRFVNKLYEQAQ